MINHGAEHKSLISRSTEKHNAMQKIAWFKLLNSEDLLPLLVNYGNKMNVFWGFELLAGQNKQYNEDALDGKL